MMSRYYLHLRDFHGDVVEDEEGSDFPTVAAAKKHALSSMRDLAAEAIRRGNEVTVEAIIVADDHGAHLAAVPIVAALPPAIVDLLKVPEKVIPANRVEDYRKNAEECRDMAEKADNTDDKISWLNLANAWLLMLPQTAHPAGWPKASDEDSQASH
jgi:hypothetical protein